LADGNRASVGDVIITRSNNRRLRLTATDWVKNGDRWTVTHVGQQGNLTVRHTRSQLYTMLTRGRAANHLYLQVVGDGDPHSIIWPETVTPRTPTETLQQILARDDSPTSATTLLRDLSDPAARLFDAVQRYTDGLQVAAEHLVGSQLVQMLNSQADKVVPELTSEPSWPTLRARLLALAAETGEHPLFHLQISRRRTRTPHRRRPGRRARLAPPRARIY
jgi:hypothetical protein